MREIIRLVEGYHFFKNCVAHTQADVRFLEEMIENATQIDYDDFVRHVGLESVQEVFHDYAWDGSGLKLKDDYHVRYFRSMYGGYPCYYLVHSAIEYIFVPADFVPPDQSGYEIADEDDYSSI